MQVYEFEPGNYNDSVITYLLNLVQLNVHVLHVTKLCNIISCWDLNLLETVWDKVERYLYRNYQVHV